MLLDKSTRSFILILEEATVTDKVDCIGEYTDTYKTVITKATFAKEISSTPVTLVDAPQDNTYRLVDEIHIHNADTVTHNIVISLFEAPTAYHSIRLVLDAGKSAHYGAYWGWSIF